MGLRTPLYDWHKTHGGVMVEFGGWDMPVRYSNITDEHLAVRTGCGLFDISHMGRLAFSGKDALDLIQHVYTNNVATMREMQVRYGLVCNERGGILDDVLVYRWSHGWSMVVNASNRVKIVNWLSHHRIKREAAFVDQTETTAMLAVQGPKALDLCAGLFPITLTGIHYYFALRTLYRGDLCVVSRTGYTGEDGIEVILPAAHAIPLADELVTRGARPCGLGARDTLRLEAAMPLYGHELGEDIDPLQAGLAWAVKLDKGDFIGRDAIVARKEDETRPVRVGLELEGRRAAREGATVSRDSRPVGRVTSGTLTPTLGKAVAMAYVEPTCSLAGTMLAVEVGKTQTPARVVPLPFYRRPA
jgi:aminomethyltransferase